MTRPIARALALAALLAAAAAAAAQETVPPERRLPSGNTAHAAGAAAGAAEAAAPAPIALTPAQDARARAIEGALRCPVCRSQSIRQSRSFMAEDMKRRIRELIVQGRSDEEIRTYFTARYGEWILLTPPRRGFNLAAYVLPLLAVGIGAVGIALAARRWSRRGSRPVPVEPLPPSPALARLERELKETE